MTRLLPLSLTACSRMHLPIHCPAFPKLQGLRAKMGQWRCFSHSPPEWRQLGPIRTLQRNEPFLFCFWASEFPIRNKNPTIQKAFSRECHLRWRGGPGGESLPLGLSALGVKWRAPRELPGTRRAGVWRKVHNLEGNFSSSSLASGPSRH